MIRKACLTAMMLLFAALPFAQRSAVSDDSAVDNLVKVLRTSNKAQTNRYVCAALKFDHVNPFNLVNFFWAATSREEGGIYSFVHPEEEKGYLVVICPEYQLPYLREQAEQMDRPKLNSAPGSKYIYYPMKHRNIADPGFLATVAMYQDVNGALIPDVETNSVLIFGAPAGSEYVEEVLANTLDKPLSQVQIAVKIYEVDVNNDGTLGLDNISWKNTYGQDMAQLWAYGGYGQAKHQNMHFNRRSSGLFVDLPSDFFDFLTTKGKAKTLIDTKITAVNRVPAMIRSTEQILTIRTDGDWDRTLVPATEPAMRTGNTFPTNGMSIGLGGIPRANPGDAIAQSPRDGRSTSNRVSSVNAGISLLCTPTIGEDTTNVALEMKVVNVTGYDGYGTPLTASREVTDQIAIANGDTVLFGGLTREKNVQRTQKIPLLGSLPVVGFIFGNEINSQKKTVVVAAISTTLVVGGNNVTDADNTLAEQASGEAVVALPQSQYMFEQSLQNLY